MGTWAEGPRSQAASSDGVSPGDLKSGAHCFRGREARKGLWPRRPGTWQWLPLVDDPTLQFLSKGVR